MFVATVRWEYKVVPGSPVMRFACVSDLAQYRELNRDPSVTAVWYFEPVGELDGASPDAFKLVAVHGRWPDSAYPPNRPGRNAGVHG